MAITSPAFERVWRELRPHLEWAAGFNLIFLFANHPHPVDVLRQRVGDSLHLRTLRLQIFAPESPEALAGLAETLLARLTPGSGPLWVELWREAAHPSWRAARNALLHCLNERRFLLERDVGLPMVLVLPSSERGGVYAQVPDLWAIRSFTADLPIPDLPLSTPIEIQQAETRTELGMPPGPAEQEWARLLRNTVDRIRLNPWDGDQAYQSALARGDLTAARRIAMETLALAREQFVHDDGRSSARNLSLALEKIGGVEGELGNLEAARAAYRENLELSRQLRQSCPDHVQYQKDLEWLEARWREFNARQGETGRENDLDRPE